MTIPPPSNKQELLKRANGLVGMTLLQLSNKMKITVPESTVHAKGWIGNVLELALGANGGNMALPDFVELGVELKTIPIGDNGKPKESTYVCVVQLEPKALGNWEQSLVKKKLSEVLWIPIEAGNQTPISRRRIGTPVLWQPNNEQKIRLKQDWQEMSNMIVMGEIDKISAETGYYLQIRPKAAHSEALINDKNQVSDNRATLPRGFYLRTCLTQSIMLTV